jgi:hypothetical protein
MSGWADLFDLQPGRRVIGAGCIVSCVPLFALCMLCAWLGFGLASSSGSARPELWTDGDVCQYRG